LFPPSAHAREPGLPEATGLVRPFPRERGATVRLALACPLSARTGRRDQGEGGRRAACPFRANGKGGADGGMPSRAPSRTYRAARSKGEGRYRGRRALVHPFRANGKGEAGGGVPSRAPFPRVQGGAVEGKGGTGGDLPSCTPFRAWEGWGPGGRTLACPFLDGVPLVPLPARTGRRGQEGGPGAACLRPPFRASASFPRAPGGAAEGVRVGVGGNGERGRRVPLPARTGRRGGLCMASFACRPGGGVAGFACPRRAQTEVEGSARPFPLPRPAVRALPFARSPPVRVLPLRDAGWGVEQRVPRSRRRVAWKGGGGSQRGRACPASACPASGSGGRHSRAPFARERGPVQRPSYSRTVFPPAWVARRPTPAHRLRPFP
ncbi:hypothetical protein EDB85DRAFT_1565576, partial [Lactarius pseudohatsudake]